MKHDDTDFTRAWNSLTTSGEMSGEPPRPFTPVGLRTDVREERDWTPLPPQALEAIRERMRQAARLGIEAINE